MFRLFELIAFQENDALHNIKSRAAGISGKDFSVVLSYDLTVHLDSENSPAARGVFDLKSLLLTMKGD